MNKADPLTAFSVLQIARPAQGGMRLHVKQLAQRLTREGVDVRIAAPLEPGPPPWETEYPFYPLMIPDRFHPLKDLQSAKVLRHHLRDRPPQLLHAHGYRAAWIAGLSSFPLKTHSLPLIATAHNLFPARTTLPGALALHLLQRPVARWIAVTHAVKESLERAGISASRIVVIPNGIDATSLQPGPSPLIRSELATPVDAPLVVMVARLEPAKGVSDGLRAFTMFRRAVPNARLWVIGEGPEKESLLGLSRDLGLGTSVQFLGWRDNATRLLSAADVCLIPSRAEGQSRVALEAMALGVPVVAAAVGGLPEMIRDNETGLLAAARNPPQMARALYRLIKDDELRLHLTEAARHEVGTHWGEERMIQDTLALYRSLLTDLSL